MYLVDTNVVFAGAPSKRGASAALVAWMDDNSADLFMSAVSIAEIEAGIARLRRQGARRKAHGLSAWLNTLLHLYAERVLPFDVGTARIAGDLSDLALSQGHAPGFADVAIAATAKLRGFTILTRNSRHFEPLGVCSSIPSQGCLRTDFCRHEIAVGRRERSETRRRLVSGVVFDAEISNP